MKSSKKKKRSSKSDDSSRKERLEKKKKRTAEKLGALNSELPGIEKHLKVLEERAAPGEKDYLREYTWMFRRTSKLIRTLEKRARHKPQSRDIYALSTLISQQREIIADIRILADFSGQFDGIRTQVLRPLIESVGQNALDVYYQHRKLIMETCKPSETKFALEKLNELLKEQSRYFQTQYQNAVEAVNSALGLTQQSSSKPPSVKKIKRPK